MLKRFIASIVVVLAAERAALGEVLIVADEFPAMEFLAGKLKQEGKIDARLIAQNELMADLAPFDAVIVYIHKEISEKAEDAFINYANSGGKLVVLHHTISSGKRKNAHWFPFLGVRLPDQEFAKGGYKWIEGVSLKLVELNPNHFIMTNHVVYDEHIGYSTNKNLSADEKLNGFTLKESEVYLNHVLIGQRTLLMGLKYVDEKSGTTYCQSHAGWLKSVGKGMVIYLMPGHSKRDFENPTYAQIVMNAVIYRP